MRPACNDLLLLPPPSSGALGFSGSYGARARCAADRSEAAVVQNMIGNVVLADERNHLFTRPIEQWVDFDQPVARRDDRKGGGDTLIGLIGTQAGDPRDSARERPPEWFDLAHGAARVSRFDRGIKSIDTLMPHQRFEPGAIGISGDNAPAVSVFGLPPEIEGLRKQPAGIEGHHVDREPLAEDRMGDGLVLDAEARREDDATGNDTPYRGHTVIQTEIEARARR